MAIFARRRLQAMLDEISPRVENSKVRDLLSRIESKEIEQALPAEMELGIVWAIAQLGPAEIEPHWYGQSSLPDVFSEHLIPSQETVVEVTALSDAVLPADAGMRNASRKISQEANGFRRGAAKRLSYYFYEETVRIGRESIRRVRVPRTLLVSENIRRSLRNWLQGTDRNDGDQLLLHEGELYVVITWHDQHQSRSNFHTSMPPEIRSLRDNYVYRALLQKAKQLKSPLFQGLKCVILADVGSTALRRVDETDHTARVFHGKQIITEFLRTRGSGLDVVAVITPERAYHRLTSLDHTLSWKLRVFCHPGVTIDIGGFEKLLRLLPPPSLEGYQSRQLHEQGVFSPLGRGRYMGTTISWRKGEKTEIKFSARAFVDTLAGRETPERFMRMLSSGTNGSNFIKLHLDRGETISAIRLESGGLDEDDDQIVIEFRDDPGARRLDVPE